MSDVVIVGAGMAGLVCAADLTRAGIEVTVVEASDGIGGRVRTDEVDGFRLDRGFQILLTGYPQVKQRIDLARLELGRFVPGAIVRTPQGTSRLSNPLGRPQDLLATLTSPVASLRDKLRLAALVLDVTARPAGELLRRPDVSTGERPGPRRLLRPVRRELLGTVLLGHSARPRARGLLPTLRHHPAHARPRRHRTAPGGHRRHPRPDRRGHPGGVDSSRRPGAGGAIRRRDPGERRAPARPCRGGGHRWPGGTPADRRLGARPGAHGLSVPAGSAWPASRCTVPT